MKKTIILLMASMLSFITYAQRDIKTLDGKTTQQIINIMGTPQTQDLSESFSDFDDLYYEDTRIGIIPSSKSIDFFKTASKKYCVLSHLVSGGIKVGDSLSKLQSISFASTPYGRNKQSNALKPYNGVDGVKYPIYGYNANYVIYESEYCSIYLAVVNGIIKSWSFRCKPDSPYENYDSSIKIW